MFGRASYERLGSCLVSGRESVKKHVILFSVRTIHYIIEWLWSLDKKGKREKRLKVALLCVNATAKPNETEK